MSKPISEQYRLAAKEWVEADKAASLLEECKTPTLSQKMLALGDMPVSKAEMIVKGSTEWRGYLEAMVEARTQANLLKVKTEWLKMRHAEGQSQEATARAEMRL